MFILFEWLNYGDKRIIIWLRHFFSIMFNIKLRAVCLHQVVLLDRKTSLHFVWPTMLCNIFQSLINWYIARSSTIKYTIWVQCPNGIMIFLLIHVHRNSYFEYICLESPSVLFSANSSWYAVKFQSFLLFVLSFFFQAKLVSVLFCVGFILGLKLL